MPRRLLRDGRIVADDWVYLAEAEGNSAAPLILTLAEWQNDRDKWLAQDRRLGVVLSVVLTELATTLLLVAILPLSLSWTLALLPIVGLMLNGTSSVLYGTIPEFVRPERRTHAFAVFYTGGSVAGASSPFLFGVLGDMIGLVPALVGVGGLALLTVPMVVALRPALVLSEAKDSRATPAPSDGA